MEKTVAAEKTSWRRGYNRASLALLTLDVVWLALLFLSPTLLPPGTVTGLDGMANHLDYPDKWGQLPPVVAQVYWFGDLNCHQKWYRSFYIHGNQMPVCARDTGMFSGIALGFLALSKVRATPDLFETGIRALPGSGYLWVKKHLGARKGALVLFALLLAPMAVDGFTQALTSYESTNPVRYITGFMGGTAIAGLLGAMIESALAAPPIHGKNTAGGM